MWIHFLFPYFLFNLLFCNFILIFHKKCYGNFHQMLYFYNFLNFHDISVVLFALADPIPPHQNFVFPYQSNWTSNHWHCAHLHWHTISIISSSLSWLLLELYLEQNPELFVGDHHIGHICIFNIWIDGRWMPLGIFLTT